MPQSELAVGVDPTCPAGQAFSFIRGNTFAEFAWFDPTAHPVSRKVIKVIKVIKVANYAFEPSSV
jgi:hypothetical protein